MLKKHSLLLSWTTAFVGLLLLASYWFSVRPPSNHTGYFEDYCFTDFSRQIAAEQLAQFGRPYFESTHVMAPFGASIPYLSWSPERDWLGSFFWRWNPEFPFAWVFTGFSWLLTYFFVGFVLTRMGKSLRFSSSLAWFFAMLVVLFHVPRHFKIWHHWEHLNQHWVYIGFFLDAWIWTRLTREKTWDRRLEAWRAFALAGMLLGVGTFWGPLILEWVIVRAGIAIFFRHCKKNGEPLVVTAWGRATVLPFVLSVLSLAVVVKWYLPLYFEVRKLGTLFQPTVYFAHIAFFVRPLWLDPLLKVLGFADHLKPLDTPETVVTVGWFYWIPALLVLWRCWVERQSKKFIFPFAVLLFSAVVYASVNEPTHVFQATLQTLIPFMGYFRVASRWGLFLPQILAIITLLGWPELSAWWRSKMVSRRRLFWIALGLVFVELSCTEMTWLTLPVNAMPPLPQDALVMLKAVHDSPGTAVLDLPFCVAGGNALCTDEECPQYPESTISQCLRIWHGKDVYGLYAARMAPKQCDIYRREPFDHWFSAWRENRCFNPPEWKDFCGYIGAHSELSAVMLYPDIWSAAGKGDCLKEFENHLGPALSEATVMNEPTRGGKGAKPTRIFRFPTHCLR